MKSYRVVATASLLVASLVLATPAALAAPPPGGPLHGACKADVETLCKDIQPGGGRIAACLKANAAQVSDGCKAALKARHDRKAGGEGGAAPARPTEDAN